MAKTVKVKKSTLQNPRSRAAKRATSPSIDVDDSIKNTSRASDATPILGARLGAGIHKKKKNKHISRGQRSRQEKGLARAEAVQDRTSQKVAGAKSRQKKINARKSLWDDVNQESKNHPTSMILAKTLGPDEDEWVDGEDENAQTKDQDAEMKIVDGVVLPASAAVTELVVFDRTASVAGSEMGDEMDKIN